MGVRVDKTWKDPPARGVDDPVFLLQGILRRLREGHSGDPTCDVPGANVHFDGPVFLNGGFDAGTAEQALVAGDAEAISFGNLYIANPDLVARLDHGYPLSEVSDPNLIYSPTVEGYSDFPSYPADNP